MTYKRHESNNSESDPQPGSVSKSLYSGDSEGWSTVAWKDWNADYQARKADNTTRTPGTYQARKADNSTRTPAAYQRHDKDNNAVEA